MTLTPSNAWMFFHSGAMCARHTVSTVPIEGVSVGRT